MTITPSLLFRLSAAGVIAAFALNLTGGLLHPVVDGNAHSVESLTSGFSPWAQMLLLAGTIVQLIALPGVYAWFSAKAGLAGLIGFVLLYGSSMLVSLTHLTIEAFASYELAANPATAHLVPADGSLFPSTAFTVLQIASGSTFQSLSRGTSTEADLLNGEIVLLGRLHGVPTPVNALLQQTCRVLARDGAPPRSGDASDLLARLS